MFKTILSRPILAYFRILADRKLRQNPKALIIGITGSAGKTSTSLALAQILGQKGTVKHSLHANSESGIPLDILGLSPHNYSPFDWLRLIFLAPFRLLTREHFRYYIVEMGVDSPFPPKNMGYLLRFIKPDLAIILNASISHAFAFDSLIKDRDPKRRRAKLQARIAQEKMQLALAVHSPGTAVVNADQADFLPYLPQLSARLLTFGTSARSNLCFTLPVISRAGFRLDFTYQNQTYSLQLTDIFSAQYGYTFAAAIAASAALGIPPKHSLTALTNYHAPAGRLRLLDGKNHTHILDSSYNASPVTMLEALQLLSKLGGRAKKIAVLGDMRELGSSSKHAHQLLADQIIRYSNEVLLFGPETLTYTLPRLKTRHFPAHHFTSMSSLNQFLLSDLTPNAWILVKGSQNNILLERAIHAILANPSDVNLLCRRGAYWDQIRQNTP
ncbi:MAG: UDP-N-acetylmuramoyl-tripeptide-D-alanyl-D-alanine ligase [Microgenomates group bacterium GW2011_GWC1_46_16]|uniref:Mur ligase central domain-containing protein n=2 Tax=Candidatus Collieribacteriota TaxID=1752725 RepID=A0A1F5FXW8_9BACT|nr:MAG: UDP-N-acetylmuramoyl-tripeptide-D-alanyl-D-alanine ligase [Microgenomates group bacterium GW2011_GWF1_46_12]KKU26269.1 MAG: UDP-N-acetylmuramoyl-tripeptide-D-alanyl-D-alanine ligase [Microgenomates group bacterium GW2011_GWC1_46_16]KKU27636.1 MAG: UDP-N-acetylmuramoyl-tripeptide-D-alanyl-D-alanine ligase [Microgenomates group bacterium GW2011_GWF2_46_18]KKU43417.1 MAG: UDP-N-acetylmuramoyl-tripeptide-D-alanyl-D-alanine ligase [Microgenomates group bacterium GW2011_GWA1_46_7]KKU45357.1 M